MPLCSPVDKSWWFQTRWTRARTLVGPAQLHLAESNVMGLAQLDGCLAEQITGDPLYSSWLGYAAFTGAARARAPVAECLYVAQRTSLGGFRPAGHGLEAGWGRLSCTLLSPMSWASRGATAVLLKKSQEIRYSLAG